MSNIETQQLNLYILHRNNRGGYDTYDSFVVAARNKKEALTWHPNNKKISDVRSYDTSWPTQHDKVTVTFIGTATDGIVEGVICSSFNAG